MQQLSKMVFCLGYISKCQLTLFKLQIFLIEFVEIAWVYNLFLFPSTTEHTQYL